ncbi:unnamed protein product [Caenorhabditis sp. 36 PRJEB53466]|nr:unnamed protein product [Caenorhabditis sp. 36 PRJEB53466]
MNREEVFAKARQQAESEAPDDALETLAEITSQEGVEYSLSEIQTINIVVCEKLTSCPFEEKKEACLLCLPILEGIKCLKSAEWLELYTETVYETFSKLSRYAREEERSDAWYRLKAIFYEITLAAKKVWKEKNAPAGLDIYVYYAKLLKSYLDVADEDAFKECENYAKEAKFLGKGILEDEDYRDAKKAMETINKLISEAKKEQELLSDD